MAASPAFAQAPPGIDGKKPVEVNSDTLEVRQEENIAIFTGNVIAVQEDTRLHSDRMVVHYRNKADKAGGGGQAGVADPAQSDVEKIEVEGNVLLVNPEESAAGDRGVYDVSQKKVHLLSNVVLIRGENVLKGESLVYDFATGKSVVNSPQHTPPELQSKGRVRALFTPGNKE